MGVPFETLSAKPVALAPVGATVKAGVHTSPFLATKRGDIPSHARGRNTPQKDKKTGVTPPLCRGSLFRSSVLSGCYWLFGSATLCLWLLGFWLALGSLWLGSGSFSICLSVGFGMLISLVGHHRHYHQLIAVNGKEHWGVAVG